MVPVVDPHEVHSCDLGFSSFLGHSKRSSRSEVQASIAGSHGVDLTLQARRDLRHLASIQIENLTKINAVIYLQDRAQQFLYLSPPI